MRSAVRYSLLMLAVLCSACGGGGGSDGGSIPSSAQPAPAPVAPTTAELNTASRLASQTTFGTNYTGIEEIARQGTAAWLDTQLDLRQP